METTPATFFYAAPLTSARRVDNWHHDTFSRPADDIRNLLAVKVNVEAGDLRTAQDCNPTFDVCELRKFGVRSLVDQKDFMSYGADPIEASK